MGGDFIWNSAAKCVCDVQEATHVVKRVCSHLPRKLRAIRNGQLYARRGVHATIAYLKILNLKHIGVCHFKRDGICGELVILVAQIKRRPRDGEFCYNGLDIFLVKLKQSNAKRFNPDSIDEFKRLYIA